MSSKIGRNDPCRCGSGKKYKRCCLDADAAAARAPQEVSLKDSMFDLDVEADDEDDYFEVEDEAPPFDAGEIVRVCYTRGMVGKLSDLRAGRGVRVTEWNAPHIPPAVLDSIVREGVAVFAGEWGDPKAGDPIQVDIIDIESERDVVTIQVFNRAISLIHDSTTELRRILRVCGVLESSDGGQLTDGAGATAAAADSVGQAALPPSPVAIDVSAILKAHRRQGGTCAVCGEAVTRQGARKHLTACVPAHDLAAGPEQRLVHVRATAPGLAAYWLDLEIRADARLDALDSFLRRIWLECCGHLSAFAVGTVKYFSSGYDLGFDAGFGSLGRQRIVERSMSARLATALPPFGERFEYEYDFGSTTALQLTAVAERIGRPGLRSLARLLARNTAPVWPCAFCGQPATSVCSYCLGDPVSAFTCDAHLGDHDCGEVSGLLPVVNSPRMGVCGYCDKT